MIEVINRQRRIKVNCSRWKSFSENALSIVPTEKDSLTVVFVSDRKMKELNRVWRGKPGTTDVLSFPASTEEFEAANDLGDVVISIDQAERQAKENKLTLNNEISQLILHGIIHLCGYDHASDTGEMDRLEIRLRQRLGI